MEQQFPDYNNCIGNLANSILGEFEIERGEGLKLLDKYLEENCAYGCKYFVAKKIIS